MWKTLVSILQASSVKATYTHMMEMVRSYHNESDFLGELVRSFHNSDDFYLNSYSRYGCWCYLGLEFSILGMESLSQSTPPVNEVDTFCHELHNGYECIDISDEQNTCYSRMVDYEVPKLTGRIWVESGNGNVDEKVRKVCEEANFGDKCKSKTCEIELQFIIKMMDWQKATLLGAKGSQIDKFLHETRGGSFSPQKECKPKTTEPFLENNACCGESVE